MKRIFSFLLVFVLIAGLTAVPAEAAQAAPNDVWRFNYEEGFRVELYGSHLRFVDLPKEALIYLMRGSTEVKYATLTGSGNVQLSGLSDGTYNVEVYLHYSGNDYVSYVYGSDLQIRKTGNSWAFVESVHYTKNMSIYTSKRTDAQAQEYYKKPSPAIQSDHKDIISKANELAAGTRPGIEEVRKICDWVSANLWYDWDAVNSGKLPPADALSTLKRDRAVCEGYVNLAAALLRARGYAAKFIPGYSDGVGHCWLEIFVDGYVILSDPTFNSGNAWENGRKAKSDGLHNNRYFNADMRSFSRDHEYMDYSERAIPAADMRPLTARPSGGKLQINGKMVDQALYNVSSSNRSQMRFLALMFSGTDKPFDARWDSSKNAIVVTTGERYMPTGAEITSVPATDRYAVPTIARVIWDGRLAYMEVYNIDSSNYFKLRDVCRLLDVYAEWSASDSLITVDTSRRFVDH